MDSITHARLSMSVATAKDDKLTVTLHVSQGHCHLNEEHTNGVKD